MHSDGAVCGAGDEGPGGRRHPSQLPAVAHVKRLQKYGTPTDLSMLFLSACSALAYRRTPPCRCTMSRLCIAACQCARPNILKVN